MLQYSVRKTKTKIFYFVSCDLCENVAEAETLEVLSEKIGELQFSLNGETLLCKACSDFMFPKGEIK